MGADPMAVATALLAAQQGRALGAFSVRKEAKSHGTGGRLVGPVSKGEKVAVLDDTVTTGGAVLEALTVLEAEGLEVVQVLVLVDRSQGSLGQICRDRNLELTAFVLPSDLGVE
jgi:orotate phosphoribosyltransferase